MAPRMDPVPGEQLTLPCAQQMNRILVKVDFAELFPFHSSFVWKSFLILRGSHSAMLRGSQPGAGVLEEFS